MQLIVSWKSKVENASSCEQVAETTGKVLETSNSTLNGQGNEPSAGPDYIS